MRKNNENPGFDLEPVKICATCRHFKIIEDVFSPGGVDRDSYMISSCLVHKWRTTEHYLKDISFEISADLSNPCPDWEPRPRRISARQVDEFVSLSAHIPLGKAALVRKALIREWTRALARGDSVPVPGLGTLVPPSKPGGKFKILP